MLGFLVLAGLTAALIFAFSEKLLPYQDDGNVFDTIYAYSEYPEETSDESEGDFTDEDD